MIRKNLTKQDIAEKINEKLGFSKEEAKSFMDSFFSIIEDKVVAGEEIKIPKLGNFLSKTKKERYGRNPKTGEIHLINSRKSVSFTASKKLIKKINS